MKPKYRILFIGLLCALHSLRAQDSDVAFQHVHKGLSSNFVRAILQDYQGYLWVGTENGLHRYDGTRFRVFDIDPLDDRATPSGRIHALIEDHKRQLWVASFGGGVFRFDRTTERFLRLRNLEGPDKLNTSNVVALLETADHNIWMATDNGIGILNPQTGAFRKLDADTNALQARGHPAVTHLMQDTDGYIWATTYNGVNRIHPQTFAIERFDWPTEQYTHPLWNAMSRVIQGKNGRVWVASFWGGVNFLSKQPNGQWRWNDFQQSNSPLKALPRGPVLNLLEDTQGLLWISLENHGLGCYKTETDQLRLYTNNPNDPLSLSNNSIWELYQDRMQRIWIGTHAQGLDLIDPFSRKFKHIYQGPYSGGLNHKTVSSFLELNGKLWIGTDGGGITIWNPSDNSFQHLTKNQGLSSDAVLCLLRGRQGQVWAGTWAGGLMQIDPISLRVTDLGLGVDGVARSVRHIFDMRQDSKGNLWLATFETGLVHYDPRTGATQRYLPQNDNLRAVCIDNGDTVWADADRGVAKVWFEKGNMVQKLFTNDSTVPFPVRSRAADALFADSSNRIWMGFSEGLVIYDAGRYFFFNKKNGLTTNFVNGIWQDHKGFYWLSTDKGLVRLRYTSPGKINDLVSYNEGDGLQGNLFFRHSFYQGADKTIYTGGGNGFNYFHLHDLSTNPEIPQIQFSDFKIFNKSVDFLAQNSPLAKHVNETELVVLNHRQNIFSIEYVALAFTKPERNQYAYQLEGLETEWNYVGTQQTATYTNLDAGEYVFRVKAANSDGRWLQEPRSLRIRILPPFWQTTSFRLITLLLIVVGAMVFYRLRVRQLKQKSKRLAQMVAQRTEELQQANQLLQTQKALLLQTNEELQLQKEEILAQKEEISVSLELLEKQKEHIQEQNILIKSSITYAHTIQQATLPDSLTTSDFRSFVLYMPKDIVSGDFFWFYKPTRGENAGKRWYFAVVDCTGHGVPGGFMAMIGQRLLNEIVIENQVADTDKILIQLDLKLKSALNQEKTNNHDGMDVALCRVDKLADGSFLLQFTGAKRPLFVFSQQSGLLTQLKGDRKPAGGKHYQSLTFTAQEVRCQENDLFYLSSDGLIDQNSPDRKRFGTPKFHELLQEIGSLPLDEQFERIDEVATKFRGTEEQRDDITIWGVKL